MLGRTAIALAASAALAGSVAAQTTVCAPGAAWLYTGTAKGTPEVRNTGKATYLEFTPTGPTNPDTVVFTSTNTTAVGVYQVNADIDVVHLSDDAAFQLDGAESAAAGRPFEVVMAAGDGGSSGFSRPITTMGKPFTIALKTQASAKISVKIRNYVVCKLR